MGERRSKRTESAYVAPWVTRALAKEKGAELAGVLRRALQNVREGGGIVEVLAGTREGWHARIVLSHVAGTALAVWDGEAGRTQLERRALLEKALEQLAGVDSHRGGWQVSR